MGYDEKKMIKIYLRLEKALLDEPCDFGNARVHALEICERAFNGGKTIAEDPEAVEEAMRNDEVSQLIRRAFGRERDHGGQ